MAAQYDPFSPTVLAERREKYRAQELKRAKELKRAEELKRTGAGTSDEDSGGNGQKPLVRKKRPAKEGRFINHIFPTRLMKELCLRTGCAHLCVVRHLDELWFRSYRKSESFSVESIPGKGGKPMERHLKNQTLSDLEVWGWIEIERNPGRPSRVKIKWRS
jgi:hypothetical protein